MSRADDDYDDRPRRRPRRDDDYDDEADDRPRRRRGNASGGGGGGGGMSVAVIVGIVVGVLFCCAVPAGIALLLPAIQKVREAKDRVHDTNNFRQIAIGMHNHSDTTTRFPDADGPVSVRVHILPFVEQATLYKRFDVKESWDGPKNRPLATERVPAYVSALDGETFTQTRARVFTGPDTLFPPGERALRLNEILDGTSNTILFAEAAEAVPWSKPQELPFTKNGPLPALGHPNRTTGYLVVLVDGSVRFLKKPVDESVIRSGVTPKAGDAPPAF